MTSTAHEAERKIGPDVRHPPWCGRQAVGCMGNRHRSVPVRVELDEHAGCEVQAYLRGGTERVFVEVDFIPRGALDEAEAASGLGVAASAGGGTAEVAGSEPVWRIPTEVVRALVYGNGVTGLGGNDADGTEGTEESGTDAESSYGNKALGPGGDDEHGTEVRDGRITTEPAVSLSPLDPYYVSDSHGHSLGVEQAEILGGVLGYLVRAARGGDTEALRVGAGLG